MARTITALFDTRADAEAGAERLRQAGVSPTHVNVHDQATHTAATEATDAATTGGSSIWASIKNVFVPHEDRHAYEEGMRRGGFLLTADVDDDMAPEAVAALEDANSIDLDQRTRQWRSEGWAGAPAIEDADEGVLYGTRDAGVTGTRYRSYLPGER